MNKLGYKKEVFNYEIVGGIPCLWESGGATTTIDCSRCTDSDGGEIVEHFDAKVICGPHGERKKPLYIPRNENLNGYQALIPIAVGDWIIEYMDDSYKNSHLDVSVISEINHETGRCSTIWKETYGDEIKNVVNAAIVKSRTYGCNEAMWVKLD